MRQIRVGLMALAMLVLAMVGVQARADAALLMEEPYGEFGAFNPTGHAAIYLNHICAESPTVLRHCRAGEPGAVNQPISQDRWLRLAGHSAGSLPLCGRARGRRSEDSGRGA
jgi:hypothetical protein